MLRQGIVLLMRLNHLDGEMGRRHHHDRELAERAPRYWRHFLTPEPASVAVVSILYSEY